MERTKKQLEDRLSKFQKEIQNHEDAIEDHEVKIGDIHTTKRNEMAAAAWKTPEQILKSANNNLFDYIKFFDLSEADKSYSFHYYSGPSDDDYKIQIKIANHNVSLFLYPIALNSIIAIEEKADVYLFHPADTAKYQGISIIGTFKPNKRKGKGSHNWMTLKEFKEHVKDGRFAVGVV